MKRILFHLFIAFYLFNCTIIFAVGTISPDYQARTISQITHFESILKKYYRDNHKLPKGTTSLDAVPVLTKLDYFYQDKNSYLDPWGTPYKYKLVSNKIIVYSFGPNKRDNNGIQDDITNKKKNIMNNILSIGHLNKFHFFIVSMVSFLFILIIAFVKLKYRKRIKNKRAETQK